MGRRRIHLHAPKLFQQQNRIRRSLSIGLDVFLLTDFVWTMASSIGHYLLSIQRIDGRSSQSSSHSGRCQEWCRTSGCQRSRPFVRLMILFFKKMVYNPSDSLTWLRTMSLNLFRSSLQSLHASMLAPLSSLGSASMLTTDNKIFSTLCTGDHRSDASS